MSVTVDTNVILYAFDTRDHRKQQHAADLIASLSGGVLLWQVAVEFVAASRKLSTLGLTASDAWRELEEMRGFLPLVLPSARTLDRAKVLSLTGNVQFWDALIYAARQEAGVSRIYSEDLPGSAIEGLEVVNPFERSR